MRMNDVTMRCSEQRRPGARQEGPSVAGVGVVGASPL